jgi:HK97 family phage prohead protease
MSLPLYADTVPPLMLSGYASCFEVDYRIDGGSSWERVDRGAFALSAARPVFLALSHDHGKRYAWTGDRSLRLWQDGHGLAFEAKVAWGDGAPTIVNGIRRGEFAGVSVGFAKREIEVVSAGDREVEVVRKAEIDEISLTWAPACPCTAVWLTDDPQDGLSAHVAAARAHWAVGKMRAELAAARWPGARARAAAAAGLARAAAGRASRASVPESVLHVLACHGPRDA